MNEKKGKKARINFATRYSHVTFFSFERARPGPFLSSVEFLLTSVVSQSSASLQKNVPFDTSYLVLLLKIVPINT